MFEEQENNFLKLSNPQLDMFSSKLVDLAEVQDMAHAGEDMKPFIARLRSMLKTQRNKKYSFHI